MLLWLLACAKEPALDTAGLVEPVEDVVQPLDMENPTDNTMAFAKMRGSLQSDEEVVFYWHGYIYNHELQDPYGETETSYSASPIMAFEGYNIAVEKISDTEYLMLSREITVYKNLFGKIIDCFDNRAVNAEDSEWVPVVHVQNDPVNLLSVRAITKKSVISSFGIWTSFWRIHLHFQLNITHSIQRAIPIRA